jgi:hypothetical protein
MCYVCIWTLLAHFMVCMKMSASGTVIHTDTVVFRAVLTAYSRMCLLCSLSVTGLYSSLRSLSVTHGRLSQQYKSCEIQRNIGDVMLLLPGQSRRERHALGTATDWEEELSRRVICDLHLLTLVLRLRILFFFLLP